MAVGGGRDFGMICISPSSKDKRERGNRVFSPRYRPCHATLYLALFHGLPSLSITFHHVLFDSMNKASGRLGLQGFSLLSTIQGITRSIYFFALSLDTTVAKVVEINLSWTSFWSES